MDASSRRARLLFDVMPKRVEQIRAIASRRETAETKPGSRPANYYMYPRLATSGVCEDLRAARRGAKQRAHEPLQQQQ